MARQKIVYVYFYTDNDPDLGNYGASNRVVVGQTFASVYKELIRDVDYFMSKGAHIIDEAYNDPRISVATSAKVALRMPDNSIMVLHIDPSAVI